MLAVIWLRIVLVDCWSFLVVVAVVVRLVVSCFLIIASC